MHEALKKGLSEDLTAQTVSNWAKEVFGMSACHPAGTSDDGTPRKDHWPPPEGTGPPPPEEKNPLVKLLMDVSETQSSLLEDYLLLTNRVNIHRCSDYCLRQQLNSKERRCRMDFGTETNPGKEIRSNPALVRDRNNSLRLEMERDHPNLVQHSRYHTQAWRANGDISIILSKSDPENPSVEEILATEKYVSGYACKGNEPTGAVADLFNDIVNAADEDHTSAKSLCTKLLMRTVKRDVSAVEASYEITGLPLYRCSHQFQSISMTGSRLLEKKGSTVTKSTPLDKYLARDIDDNSSWYSYICRSGRIPVVAGTNLRATWPLNEEYCRTMLLLHWPNWRKITDVKEENETWIEKMQIFMSSNNCPNFVKADVEKARRKEQTSNDNENGESDSEENDLNNDPDWMELIRPNVEYEDHSDFNYDDGGPDQNWTLCSHQYPPDYGIQWLHEINEEFNHLEDSVTLNIPDVDLQSLNKDQKFVFNLVLERLIQYKADPDSFQSPLRLIVAGTAGSGKSYLINCLVKAIRILFNKNKAVQVLSPTGSSANIISGMTLHSFLKIPTGVKATQEMTCPDGIIGAALQKNCEGLLALLIDERSLVGCRTLGWMEFMCSNGMNRDSNSSFSWGGLPVVVFLGDDVQLPPVCDSPVYFSKSTIPAAMHGSLVWKEFNTAVTLQTIVRQNREQTEFKNTLLALREYKITSQQAQWLQTFQWNSLQKSHGHYLLKRMSEGLHVFPTHEEEWNHNKMKLLEANKTAPIAKMTAISEGIHRNISSDKAGGLLCQLYLCKGAKVMLTANLNVHYGLFNGSMGTVVDIIYLEGRNPTNALPDVVMVKFQKYTGPAFIQNEPNLVPLVPIERKIDCRCFSCKRTQIPLRLGWGTTIHRCQGMTIGENEANRYIVINPGSQSFESRNPGALFVALSRARSAGSTTSDPDFAWNPHILVNEDRLCHVVRTPTTTARSIEIERIKKLTRDTRLKFHHLSDEDIFQQHLSHLSQMSEE